jgi:hypothetical protein
LAFGQKLKVGDFTVHSYPFVLLLNAIPGCLLDGQPSLSQHIYFPS